MIPINNSDLAWLVVSDYNEDNGIGFPYELREDVYNPEVNDWSQLFPYHYCAETIFASAECSGITTGVGGFTSWSCSVGNNSNIGTVGTSREENIYGGREMLVGGNLGRDGYPSILVGGNRHGPR